MLHERVLVSVYRALCGSSECPPVFGSHWESIGFQGSDPATDVRGGGLFSLVQLLAFVQAHPASAARLYALSRDDVQHFPFAVVGLNVSGFVLAALRSGALHAECNREGDVWRCCHGLFAAAMAAFHRHWKDSSATITSWSAVRQSGSEAHPHAKPALEGGGEERPPPPSSLRPLSLCCIRPCPVCRCRIIERQCTEQPGALLRTERVSSAPPACSALPALWRGRRITHSPGARCAPLCSGSKSPGW